MVAINEQAYPRLVRLVVIREHLHRFVTQKAHASQPEPSFWRRPSGGGVHPA